jgi:hypothetical protein
MCYVIHSQVDWQVLARAEPQAASAPGGFLNVLEIGSEPRLARGVRPLLAALREGSTVAGPVLRHLARHSQPRQVGAIAAVLLLRTALQDRIASLNGRSVDYVLQQVRHLAVAHDHQRISPSHNIKSFL